MNKKQFLIVILLASLVLLFSACGANGEEAVDDLISASGVISAKDLNISPEIGGKVVEILVDEGDWVEEGDLPIAQREML